MTSIAAVSGQVIKESQSNHVSQLASDSRPDCPPPPQSGPKLPPPPGCPPPTDGQGGPGGPDRPAGSGGSGGPGGVGGPGGSGNGIPKGSSKNSSHGKSSISKIALPLATFYLFLVN